MAAKAPADSVPQGRVGAAEIYGRNSIYELEPAPREAEARARNERIEAHLAELEEAQAAQAARAVSREAAGVLEARAEAVAETAGAWVPGREAPGYEAGCYLPGATEVPAVASLTPDQPLIGPWASSGWSYSSFQFHQLYGGVCG